MNKIKYIIVMSFGRTGSTLITSIINNQINGCNMSQEIYFNLVLEILYKYSINQIDLEKFIEEINNYIEKINTYLPKSYKNKITSMSHPHCKKIQKIQKINKQMLNNKNINEIIEIIFTKIFGNNNHVSGCKVLVQSIFFENNIEKILELFKNNSNIIFVYNKRNFNKMNKSREKKKFKIINRKKYDYFINVFNKFNLNIINYDNLQKTIKLFINKIGYNFNLNKFKKTLLIRHSY